MAPPSLPKKQQLLITGDGSSGGPKKQPQKVHAGASASSAPSSLVVTEAAASAWPGPRALMQLKLFSTLFPLSDRRHPVTTPALLFVGRALSQCVATDIGEAVRGLALASLALHMAAPARRHMPEPSSFLADLLGAFLPTSHGAAPSEKNRLGGNRGKSTAATAAKPPTLLPDGARQRGVIPALMSFKAQGKALSKVEPSQVCSRPFVCVPLTPKPEAFIVLLHLDNLFALHGFPLS